MAKNNPIDCVSLMAHDDHITMWVHRGDALNCYGVIAGPSKRSKSLRFHRMVFIATEFLKPAYLQITGCLAPRKW